MNDLFDLVGEYRQLYDMLTDAEESEEQVINDTLEGVMGEIEVKAEGIVAICNRLDMEIEACEKHKKAWENRLAVRKNAKERIKRRMIEAMTSLDKTDIQAGDVTIHMQNAGGKRALIVDENATIPERFTRLTIETDNELIRKALESGEKLDFARFAERSKTIRFK